MHRMPAVLCYTSVSRQICIRCAKTAPISLSTSASESEVASKRSIFESAALPHGVQNLMVGPIHAGVIQPGQFRFHVAGEVIEDLDIRLGYAHRGIEKLFATHYTALTGHILAERVAGDASVAHTLAFCQAVEGLTGETAPLPPAAACWRALLLEMERLYNHVGDAAALVHDMAFDLVASELAVLREQAVRLNATLTGHRLLRGAVHPGGVAICHPEALPDVVTRLGAIVERFLTVISKLVLANPACRARAETTGVLTAFEAREIGATGLPARASGLWRQDFRLRHPQGVYVEPELGTELRALIEQTITEVELPPSRSDPTRAGGPGRSPRRRLCPPVTTRRRGRDIRPVDPSTGPRIDAFWVRSAAHAPGDDEPSVAECT